MRSLRRIKNQTPSVHFKAHCISLRAMRSHFLVLLLSPWAHEVVVCRTIYLHCQICWDLHVSRVPLIVLNVIGWLIPAIGLVVVFAVTEMTYTISNHCSLRVEWITKLLLIPIIVEIGCAVVVQFGTFIYCVNIFLRSLQEPAPPTNDSLPNSTYSGGSRYPYRKAMARITKVSPPCSRAKIHR
jgi:7 transmembrane receptor (Secretin family)